MSKAKGSAGGGGGEGAAIGPRGVVVVDLQDESEIPILSTDVQRAIEVDAFARMFLRHAELVTDADRAVLRDLFEVLERRRARASKGSLRAINLADVARVVEERMGAATAFPKGATGRKLLDSLLWECTEATLDEAFAQRATRGRTLPLVDLIAKHYGGPLGGRGRKGTAWLAALLIVESEALDADRDVDPSARLPAVATLAAAVTTARNSAVKLASAASKARRKKL